MAPKNGGVSSSTTALFDCFLDKEVRSNFNVLLDGIAVWLLSSGQFDNIVFK